MSLRSSRKAGKSRSDERGETDEGRTAEFRPGLAEIMNRCAGDAREETMRRTVIVSGLYFPDLGELYCPMSYFCLTSAA